MRSWRSSGKRTLLCVLTAVLISACATALPRSVYKVLIPTLHAAPIQVSCRIGGTPDACTVLLTEDYEAIVRELKAACLALGNSPTDCQTAPPDVPSDR